MRDPVWIPLWIAALGTVGLAVTAAGAVLTAWIAVRAHGTINLLEKNTNSMKDELVKATAAGEFARGQQVLAEDRARLVALVDSVEKLLQSQAPIK